MPLASTNAFEPTPPPTGFERLITPKVVGSNPTPAANTKALVKPYFLTRASPRLGVASPALSTGVRTSVSLTWAFAAIAPVDVYRLSVPMSAANCSAAAALVPGRRCWYVSS